MALPIWPTSPVPANISRDIFWGEAIQAFDNGQEAGSTPYVKPLLRYQIQLTNIPRSKQSSLAAFFNTCRGRSAPFLFSDPYDNRVNGVTCVWTAAPVNSFFVRTAEGYPVLPASGTLLITKYPGGSTSAFTADYDTGIVSLTTPPSSGEYYVASCQYFRKCKFDSYSESSAIWDSFSGAVAFHEIALP